MFDCEIFIIEFSAINGFATHAIMVGKITSLDHELRDDSMEVTILISKGLIGKFAYGGAKT
jgi:hypothetical protein